MSPGYPRNLQPHLPCVHQPSPRAPFYRLVSGPQKRQVCAGAGATQSDKARQFSSVPSLLRPTQGSQPVTPRIPPYPRLLGLHFRAVLRGCSGRDGVQRLNSYSLVGGRGSRQILYSFIATGSETEGNQRCRAEQVGEIM